MPIKDSMIAATALTHKLVVATRNTRDFANAGVQQVDLLQQILAKITCGAENVIEGIFGGGAGVEAYAVEIEVNAGQGDPQVVTVWLPGMVLKSYIMRIAT